MTNAECLALPADRLEKGREAVEATVVEKIRSFLGSQGCADRYQVQ
jgi:fructose-bisphosphate aldolase class II